MLLEGRSDTVVRCRAMDCFRARALRFMHPSILFLLLFQPSLDYGFVWTDQGRSNTEV